MIPKIIHYCWFGRNPIPEKDKRCIESWGNFCPDFEVVRWDENNYDVNKILYTEQAYQKKRWAFVTDYARLDVIFQYGGIYLDTDVELLRSLEPLLKHHAFAGLEFADGVQYSIATGLGFGAEPHSPIIRDMRDIYRNMQFLNQDGTENTLTTPAWVTAMLKKRGFVQENRMQEVDGLTVYPTEYFSPKEYQTGRVHITPNTYSIHHYYGSWKTENELQELELRKKYTKLFGKQGGELAYVARRKIGEKGLLGALQDGMKRVKRRRV